MNLLSWVERSLEEPDRGDASDGHFYNAPVFRTLFVALVLLVTACTESVDTESGTAAVPHSPDGISALVVRVADGDSLVAEIDGIRQRVRLIGINAPETDECFGPEAREQLELLTLNQTVTLVEDVAPLDQYGRLLRYIYRGDSLINLELVADGFAMSRSYEPNTSLLSDLNEAQDLAIAGGRGMWAAEACTVTSQLSIDSIRADAEGRDDENLNDEWIEIANTGTRSVSLTGWSLRDAESVHRYSFPSGFILDGSTTIRISTGCGANERDHLYWCASGPVWNNSGDVGYLLDPEGRIAGRFEY